MFDLHTQRVLIAAVSLANSDELDPVSTDLYRYLLAQSAPRHPCPSRSELMAVLGTRMQVRDLLTSAGEDSVTKVNRMLASTNALPQIAFREDVGWHIEAADRRASLNVRFLAEVAMAMTAVVRSGELSRLSVCASSFCEGVVLDLSRNRSRRYCSKACGNRNAVNAYRARLGSLHQPPRPSDSRRPEKLTATQPQLGEEGSNE